MKKIVLLFVLVHFFNNYSMDSDFNPYEFCDQEADTQETALLMPTQFLSRESTRSQVPEIGEVDEGLDACKQAQSSEAGQDPVALDVSSYSCDQVSAPQESGSLKNKTDSTVILKTAGKRLPEAWMKAYEKFTSKPKAAKTAVVLAAAAQVHKQVSESSESEPESDDSKDADFEGNSSASDSKDSDYSASASNEEVEASDSDDEHSQELDEEFEPILKRARAALAKAAIAQPSKKVACSNLQCPHCGHIADRVSHLERHIRFHTGEKPFRCRYKGCGKTFVSKFALTRHNIIHTGEKPYECPYEGCDKKYTQQEDLKRHIKVIHLQEKIECHECGRPFAYLSHLAIHIRREHTLARPYKCRNCHKAFFNSSDLRRHERNVHHKGC